MNDSAHQDLSLDRTPNALFGDDGYELWFNSSPKAGDATTYELQTLCQGAILIGRIAARMRWDWPTLLGNVDHLSAPFDGFLLIEVSTEAFASDTFRAALEVAVTESGLNPEKVKIADGENANVYVVARGFPDLIALPAILS